MVDQTSIVDMKSMLIKGASKSFLIRVTGTIVALIVQLMLARLLGVKTFGYYAFVTSWITLLAMLGRMGFDTSTIRYLPAYQAKEEWAHFRGFLKTIFVAVLTVSCMIALLIIIFTNMFSSRMDAELVRTFTIGSVLLPILVFIQMEGYILQSLKCIVYAQLPYLVLYPLSLLTGVAGFIFLFKDKISAAEALSIEVIISVCIFIYLNVKLRNNLPAKIKGIHAKFKVKEWLTVSSSLLMFSSFYVILNQADTLMIGIYKGTTEAGIYSSVSKVAALVTFSLNAVNTILAPIISQLYSQKKKEELQRIIYIASKGIISFAIVTSIILIILGKQILSLFGPEFVSGYWSLIVLIVGQLINAMSGSTGFLMTMTGNQKRAVQVMAAATCLNIVLNFILLPPLGILGAAVATSITTIAWNLTLAYFVRKVVGVKTSVIRFKKGQPDYTV